MSHWTKTLPIFVAVLAACQAVGPEDAERTAEVAASLPEPPALTDPAAPLAAGPVRVQSDERERLELLEQKTYLLVQQHLANARAHEERLDFDAAARELERARALDPTNPIVLDYLRQVEALSGQPEGSAALLRRTARDRYEAQQQQMIALALTDLETARKATEGQDYDHAVFLMRGVVNRIAWSPDVEWGRLADDARQMLEESVRLQEAHAAELRRRRQREAYEALRREEGHVVQQEELRVRTLLMAATRAFDRGDYDGAMELSSAVLETDQHNTQALAILDAAQDAAREYADRVFIQRRREEFNRWRNEMERVRIPHTDILTLDKRRWSEVNRLRGSSASLGLGEIDPEEQELRNTLASTRIDADYDELSIDQVANHIFFTTDIPVSVDPAVVRDLDDNAQYVTLPNLRGLTVQSLLNILIAEIGAEDHAWTLRNGRVYITTREKARGRTWTRFHAIQDLAFQLTDFKGPNMREIALPGQAGDEPETTIFNSEIDRVTPIEPEEILSLVRENVVPEDWDSSDAFSIDLVDNNNLLVIHTPEVQAQVAAFLDDLRAFNTSMVTLESRFFSITDSFIEEIGTDLRGLDPQGPFGNHYSLSAAGQTGQPTQGLDNQGSGGNIPAAGVFYEDGDQIYSMVSENFFTSALGSLMNTIGGAAFQFTILDDTQVNIVMNLVAKSESATEITAPMVSVYNRQRAFVTVVNQVSYVQSFDVDVATNAFIADPVIGVIQEGIVLDIRPTISYDRKYVTLDVQTTVAEVDRPLPEFSTTVAPNSPNVSFSLPILRIQDAQTTVVVPDRGAVVLGGFKYVRYKNRTAETPWFADIPILGFFFREKGLADEVTDLIIVIRARITDVSNLQTAPVALR